MDRLILLLMGLGFGGGVEFEMRPHISYSVPIWPHPTIALPDGLMVQRNDSWAAQLDLQRGLDTCNAGVLKLRGALGEQNAAVDGLKSQSDAWVARSAKALQAARSAAAGYRGNAATIAALPEPVGNRCQAADALILAEASR